MTSTGAKRRGQILEAAVQVFANQGYDRARMEEIAETAGIAKATLYEYFASKHEMFIAAIECAYEEYLASLRKAVDEHDLFSAQLAALFERHIEYFGRVASVFYFSAQIPLGEGIRRVISKCKDGFDLFLDELIERGRRAGEVRGDLDLSLAHCVIEGALMPLSHAALEKHIVCGPETTRKMAGYILEGLGTR